MKIREIRVAGLRKPVPEGERGRRQRRDSCIYTLMTIITDEGLTGLGSVYTNDGLARSALANRRGRDDVRRGDRCPQSRHERSS